MAKLKLQFEILLPQDRKWPNGAFQRWDDLTTRYMNGTMRIYLLDDFQDTVEGWGRKPNFKATYNTPYNTRKQLQIFPVGRYTLNWSRVSEGTRLRSIVPKNAPALVFPRYYTPHTAPGGKYGGPGLRHGPTVQTLRVERHQIRPRKFAREIAKKREDRILTDLKKIALRAFR